MKFNEVFFLKYVFLTAVNSSQVLGLMSPPSKYLHLEFEGTNLCPRGKLSWVSLSWVELSRVKNTRGKFFHLQIPPLLKAELSWVKSSLAEFSRV
jgi:hypothetical protein